MTPGKPPTKTPSTTPAVTATLSPAFLTSGTVDPLVVQPRGSVLASAWVTSTTASTTLVDLELYDPSGQRVRQQWWDRQVFRAGQTRRYTLSWPVPPNAPAGTYTLKIGTFTVGWGRLSGWNNAAAQFTVSRSGE
jgi:hypothetical protein